MYTQKNNPFKVTSCGRRRTFMQDGGESPLKDKQSRAERKEFRVERAAERRSKKVKNLEELLGQVKTLIKLIQLVQVLMQVVV